ncbi:Cysteine desulfurase (EC =_ NifS [Olavius sp. associated proteobacterium Delta 1]|nr:Cysteine desulfurase (EC => NifS [Olavius sp. associated proteobacterium Delta 1]
MNVIYLDNNATTKVAPEVVEAMLPYLSEQYGNPSSMHSFGGDVAAEIKQARGNIAHLIGAESPDEIIFTSCGTESDGTAIRAAIESNSDKKHIITSRVEHPAIKNLYETLSKKGYRVTFVPVDNEGKLDLDYFYQSLSDETAIVSLMWANNETGVIFPVEELSREVKDRGIVFHTDAVQAAGKFPIDIKTTGVDMLSLSGHKLHAPKGIGVLYIRKGTKFSPYMIGGHQEHGRRGGTENVASIIALGKAAEMAQKHLADNGYERVGKLRDKLEATLLAQIPQSMVNGDCEHRLLNTSSVAFEYVEGEAILLMMNEYGICASSGSACTSGSLEPSHVLRAMGVPFTAAHGSIRFSLSRYTTEEEIEVVIEKTPPIIERLREMSPFWKEAMASN